MRKITSLIILLLSLTYVGISGAAEVRIGVVDTVELQSTIKAIWKNQKQLPPKLLKTEKDMKEMRVKLKSMREKLTDDDSKATEKLEADIKTLQQQLVAMQLQHRQDKLAHRKMATEKTRQAVKTELKGIARKHRLSFVLASHELLYAENEIDVTKELMDVLKKKSAGLKS